MDSNKILKDINTLSKKTLSLAPIDQCSNQQELK